MRVLECDCGFVVADVDPDAAIAAAQEHARSAHGMELGADVLRPAMDEVRLEDS